MEIFLGFCIFLLAALSYASWRMGSNTPTSRLLNVFSWVDRVGRWLMISGFGLFAVGYSFASLSILPDLFFKIAVAGYILLIVAAVPVVAGFVWHLIFHQSLYEFIEDAWSVRSLDWYTLVERLSKALHFVLAFIVSTFAFLMRRSHRKQNEFEIETSVERSEKEMCESLGHYYLPENDYYLLLSDDDD